MAKGQDHRDLHRSVNGKWKAHPKASGFKLWVLKESGQVDKGEKGPATYPADHKPFMSVTAPGSSCSNCRYISEDGKSCASEHFQKWNGSKTIPFEPGHDASNSCSDFWEPKK